MARGRGNWGLTVHVNPPWPHVELTLSGLADKAVDYRPVWPAAAQAMADETAAIIDSRGAALAGVASYGGQWEPADSRYLRRKARDGRGGVDLLYTGTLRSRLSAAAGVLRQTPTMLQFGVKGLPYAAMMNFVRRPFLGWTNTLRARCTELLNAHMRAVAAAAETKIGRAA